MASACSHVTPAGDDAASPAPEAAADTTPELPTDAPAEPRFGSHQPCDANPQCPDGEACGYLVAAGCTAVGECVTASGCSEHAPQWCGCDDRPHRYECPGLPSYYAHEPVQTAAPCPSEDAGIEPCDGAAPGEKCTIDTPNCCGEGYCDRTKGICCLLAYQPCVRNEECCSGRCSDENVRLKRCLP